MIYEIRSYQLKPRMVPEAEKWLADFHASSPGAGRLLGSFHGEIGALNDVVQIWAHEGHASRASELAEQAARIWPPQIEEFLLQASLEIVEPFKVLPDFLPGEYGPYFELREYEFIPGRQDSISETWSAAIPERVKRSLLLLAGFTSAGSVNKLVHLWPYHSLEERMEVRSSAVKDGIWPPPSAESPFLSQHTRILLPASFSPTR